MDRTHPTLAPHADGLHPAVLRAIDLTVRAAARRAAGSASAAASPAIRVGALILTGLGVTELSMSLPEHRGGEGGDAAATRSRRRRSSPAARSPAPRPRTCAALPLP